MSCRQWAPILGSVHVHRKYVSAVHVVLVGASDRVLLGVTMHALGRDKNSFAVSERLFLLKSGSFSLGFFLSTLALVIRVSINISLEINVSFGERHKRGFRTSNEREFICILEDSQSSTALLENMRIVRFAFRQTRCA